ATSFVGLDSTGTLAAVANLESDTVTVFDVDPVQGVFTPHAASPEVAVDAQSSQLGVVIDSSDGLIVTANGGPGSVGILTRDPGGACEWRRPAPVSTGIGGRAHPHWLALVDTPALTPPPPQVAAPPRAAFPPTFLYAGIWRWKATRGSIAEIVGHRVNPSTG